MEFIVHEWMQSNTLTQQGRLGGKHLFVTCGSKCYMLTKEESIEAPHLKLTQGKSDTALLLHVSHMSKDKCKIVCYSC